MYQYSQHDQQLVDERVGQFRSQVQRYLAGEMSDDEFRPLRLQNGLYIQRLAPMLRVSIPYGMLSSDQLRALAAIARDYDKGYGHISTRQNIQFNWPRLEQVPELLARLAAVQMHAIQTSGNCIRNITTDQFAGAAADEVEDPRPWCEIIRQWACFHPEFAFLPRKFKIAVSASQDDRAAAAVHDIGLQLRHREDGAVGFQVRVGGGLGRTPAIGRCIRDFLPWQHLLTYLESILRLYNLLGRRDNRYKARIKILLKAIGTEEFARRVEEDWNHVKDRAGTLTVEELERVKKFFIAKTYPPVDVQAAAERIAQGRLRAPEFDRWLKRNVEAHREPGYAIVSLPLKRTGLPPGDITDTEMEQVAKLADMFSDGEVRTTHEQNLVLADVPRDKLYELWEVLRQGGFAEPNIGTLNDIICCPGGDYCSLANAKSIPVAEAIQRKFDNLDYLHDLGEINLNISGCMNACGHHHVGHIGILGVDKKGREYYQVSIGGNAGRQRDAALGTILGPSFSQEDIPAVVEKILQVYIEQRQGNESFLDTCQRIGTGVFRERVYAAAN